MVDARQVDLACDCFRSMADLQTGYETELDGLARKRERPGDDSLACDHGCNRSEDHHRNERPIGVQAIERVFERFGSCKQ